METILTLAAVAFGMYIMLNYLGKDIMPEIHQNAKIAAQQKIEKTAIKANIQAGKKMFLENNRNFALGAATIGNYSDSNVEVMLMEGTNKKLVTHARTYSDDVLYVGGNCLVDGEGLEEWQVMHFFDNGTVRIYSNRQGGYANNIERDVHIDSLRPIIYLTK